VSSSSLHADNLGGRLLKPYILPPRLIGAVYRDFLCTVLPELLQDVDVQSWNHLWFIFHTFSSCSSGILEQPVSEEMDSSKWTNRTACSFPWLKSLNSFISVYICSLLFVLQKSVTSRTCKHKHWMDSRWSVRHLEISSETGSHCSEVPHPRWCSRWTLGAFSLVLRRL